MKYFLVPTYAGGGYFRYRIHPSGRIEVKSGYSNVWMLPQFKDTLEQLIAQGAKPCDEFGFKLSENFIPQQFTA